MRHNHLYIQSPGGAQDRIDYCAGCTMRGGPAAMGPTISCQIFTTLFWRLNVWTFSVGLNVTMTSKKGRQLFCGKKRTARENPGEKILATRTRKGPPPYVGMGPPNGWSGPGGTIV